MVQKRMLESFCFDDIIKNFMIFIEPEAQSHKNARILEISKNFQFFCDIVEKLSHPTHTYLRMQCT